MVGFRDNHSARPPRYRYVRSFAPFVFAFAFLAFLLSSLALLSHYRSPAIKQQIGWQSWDIVRIQANVDLEAAPGNGTDGGEVGDDPWLWDDLGYTLPLDDWVRPSLTSILV
jgi:hypothetical protein